MNMYYTQVRYMTIERSRIHTWMGTRTWSAVLKPVYVMLSAGQHQILRWHYQTPPRTHAATHEWLLNRSTSLLERYCVILSAFWSITYFILPSLETGPSQKCVFILILPLISYLNYLLAKTAHFKLLSVWKKHDILLGIYGLSIMAWPGLIYRVII